MSTDGAVLDELQRIRQDMALPRPIRSLGPADFSLRPTLLPHVHRYARGRCMDFAVAVAAHSGLALAALYCPDGRLSHAFLVEPGCVEKGRLGRDATCMDVGGTWKLSELATMSRHVDSVAVKARLVDPAATLAQMAAQAAGGADFDGADVVLAVAGCLPHLRGRVPERFRAAGPADALARLEDVRRRGWRAEPSDTPAPRAP